VTPTPLICHPAGPVSACIAVSAAATWGAGGELQLHYRISGPIDALIIPEPAPPEATDGLWQHTCCEAFAAAVDGPNYREFNLSPSGRWAAYRFADYRQRDTAWRPPAAPRIDCRREGDSLLLAAVLPAFLLPPAAPLRLGLTAVLESANGDRSYWALHHPGAQPDFHLRAGFTLDLNRP
jgi:hypothetical protein